jgi:hypothetical protein
MNNTDKLLVACFMPSGAWGLAVLAALMAGTASAQFGSGSDGSDGALTPQANVEIDMADHPDGIYQYTSVNIPAGVVVTFLPNAANTPVTWLIQTTCVIDGTVSLNGQNATTGNGPGEGGPGGFRGGQAALAFPDGAVAGPGGGPGGGNVSSGGSPVPNTQGANASYGALGDTTGSDNFGPRGAIYGNEFILPLIGGSGGSGGNGTEFQDGGAGGGGGGAILMAADTSITIGTDAIVAARGGDGFNSADNDGGGGSGGALRFLAPQVTVAGTVTVLGGDHPRFSSFRAGLGRIRFDGSVVDIQQTASRVGISSLGSLGIVMLPLNVGPQLQITTVGGVPVTVPTTGNFDPLVPNVEVPAALSNPIDVVVVAANIPVATDIEIVVRPQVGPAATFTSQNTGTEASSTATVSVTLPSGDGTLHAAATVVTGKEGDLSAASLRETGVAPNGERFARIEMATALGGVQRSTFITESGKRYVFPPVK